ncbi:MAG TPA: HNH endonuclease [Candidatus Angelobacter sp.]|jgi:hypothetical protein|nr:HNH endonuclease [Candidatus Angelobacter sp.]
MPDSSVDELLVSMLQPKEGLEYYSVRLTADSEGRICRSACTQWVGFTESEPRLEIRKGRLVSPEIMIDSWKKLSVPYWVVSAEEEMIAYLCWGGEALVEKNLGERYFADVIAPNVCAHDGPLGFKGVHRLPEQAFFRSPRPKLRMTVLKRDQYRCRLCGRRPADYSDVVIHVHHIRPWATGGLTEEPNLICLCHTCHSGLSPHDEPELFNLIGRETIPGDGYAKEIVDGMFRYRHLVKQDLELVKQDLEREIAMSNAEKSKNPKRDRRKSRATSTHRPRKQEVRFVPIADVKGRRQPGALRGKLRVGLEFFEPLAGEE